MSLNPGKCYYMCLGSKTEKAEFLFDRKIFENSKEEAILGITVDNKITFYDHSKELCKKAFSKICTLSRILPYLDSLKKSLQACNHEFFGAGEVP